jgi:hypothetical protein
MRKKLERKSPISDCVQVSIESCNKQLDLPAKKETKKEDLKKP